MIIAFIYQDHHDWDLHLYEFRFAFNTEFHTHRYLYVHTSIKLSPAFSNLGRILNPKESLRREIEGNVAMGQGDIGDWSERIIQLQNLRDWVAENLRLAYERQANYLNSSKRPFAFDVGDRALVEKGLLSKAI